MASRPSSPRNNAIDKTSSTRTIVAVTGCFSKFAFVDGARLRPINATIVPVTIGGITRSIHRTPAKCTMTPIKASNAPTTTIPPSADDCPFDAVAASTGAMIAKLEPR